MSENIRKAKEALFASANEDYCGLYDAIWELNSMFPELALGDKYKLAHAALEALLIAGLIQLERRTTKNGKPCYDVLAPDQAAGIFSNPTSWYPEYPENEQIGFAATQKGVAAWIKGGNGA